MEITKLPFGAQAPEESDCISVLETDDGRYYLNTSALSNCPEEDEAESTSVIGSAPYASYEAAEAAGLAIAAEQCVPSVFISRMKLEQV